MWYVIQVQARREREISERCRAEIMQLDEDVFIMQHERMFRTDRGREKKLFPLFGGYVFADTEDIDDFRVRLRSIHAMTKVLGTGGEVMPIYPEEEEFLRRIGGADHIVRFSEGYQVGDRLVVTDGPMKGWEGAVKRIDRHKRYAVLGVSLMGQAIDIELGIEVLRKG